MSTIDILHPREAIENYKNQIRHTLDAYSMPHIVIGEALQNALDAIAQRKTSGGAGAKTPPGQIDIHLNFDQSVVTVSDNGLGFPNSPSLFILGGSGKLVSSKTVSGMVGVGIKVVLYCSQRFSVQANTGKDMWKVEVYNAYKFQSDSNLKLEIPDPFSKDATPLKDVGTRVTYEFPHAGDLSKWPLRLFMDAVRSRIIDPELGPDAGFTKIASAAGLDSPAVHLLKYYLARFSYAGDTLAPVGGRPGLSDTTIALHLTASKPNQQLGEFWGSRWGSKQQASTTFRPGYLDVTDTVGLTKVKTPGIFRQALGNGGESLERTASGFNVQTYLDLDGYRKLLLNARGDLPKKADMDRFEQRLFPKINCIRLTIGRIPQLNSYLPHGARRVLSANGVVTEHDLEITSGRNQQYVRCVDLLIDLDANLNYGKTQITNMPLVGLVRDYVNEAYRRTLQSAAANFVGLIVESDDDEQQDVFWQRPDLLGLPGVPIKKEPRDENDVIALFAALVGAGNLSDYLIYGLSQMDQYDSRMIMRRESDRPDLLTAPTEQDLRVVEFKLEVAGVVRDFESGAKDPQDLHLLIAWTLGSLKTSRFSVEGIEHSKAYSASPKKVFPGVKHFIHDNKTGKELQVLLLKDFIKELPLASSKSESATAAKK